MLDGLSELGPAGCPENWGKDDMETGCKTVTVCTKINGTANIDVFLVSTYEDAPDSKYITGKRAGTMASATIICTALPKQLSHS
jgi:hypothetical protein